MSEVSVVIPTVRFDDWLEEAITSVLLETGTRLILVLDGLRLPRHKPAWAHSESIEVVELPLRRGAGAAANAGIARINGGYVARLDSDDRALSGRFQLQKRYLDTHPNVSVVATGFHWINESGQRVPGAPAYQAGDLRQQLATRGNVVGQSTVMFRHSDFVESGGYKESLQQMEDYDLWLRLGRNAEVHAIPQPLVEYRRHPLQLSNRSRPWHGYVREALRGRHALGDELGIPRHIQYSADVRWLGSQSSRFGRMLRQK